VVPFPDDDLGPAYTKVQEERGRIVYLDYLGDEIAYTLLAEVVREHGRPGG
jgi:hypothetical protein